MKAFVIILFCLLTFLLPGCKKDAASPEEESVSGQLIPLKEGNYWIYRIGYKNTGEPQVRYEYDTLRVKAGGGNSYTLTSGKKTVLPDNLYRNTPAGFYSGETLEFKYPGNPGEYCGQMGNGLVKGYDGKEAQGIILKNDHKCTYTDPDNVQHTYSDCYYYYLDRFYLTPDTTMGGHTVIRPGMGILSKDWTVIDQKTNSFTNVFCILVDYKLN